MAKHPDEELTVYDETRGFIVMVINKTGKSVTPDDGLKAMVRTIHRLAESPERLIGDEQLAMFE